MRSAMQQWSWVASFLAGLAVMCFGLGLEQWAGLPLALGGLGWAWISFLGIIRNIT